MYRTNKIKNTYGWIKATAISRAITTISPKTDWKINKFFKAPILNKTIIIWPAVKLAIKRIDKVRGRMIKLIDSISTINGIRIDGHPNGTKWLFYQTVVKVKTHKLLFFSTPFCTYKKFPFGNLYNINHIYIYIYIYAYISANWKYFEFNLAS